MREKTTVVGNWKMHGSQSHVEAFFELMQDNLHSKALAQVEMVICPPVVYLNQSQQILQSLSLPLKLGAQECSAHEEGAFTGQISAKMLKEQGCEYVIVGHSERRHYNHETDEEIADKFIAAKKAGIIPILCVGETQKDRIQNLTDSIIVGQLQPLLQRLGASAFEQAMIAYEPIWAIGTGLTAMPEQAQAVHALLRQTIAEYDPEVAKEMPILYGGSVKAANAKALFEMSDVDGALVGGASLQAQDFLAICEMAYF